MNIPVLGFLPGMPGPLELCIIAGVILLLFGNRLPSAMRSVGRSIVEFKKGINEIEDDVPENRETPAETKNKAES